MHPFSESPGFALDLGGHFSFQISGGKGHFEVYDSNEPVVAICQGCTGKGNDPATTTAATITTTTSDSVIGELF